MLEPLGSCVAGWWQPPGPAPCPLFLLFFRAILSCHTPRPPSTRRHHGPSAEPSPPRAPAAAQRPAHCPFPTRPRQGIPSLPKLHSLATGTRIQTVLLLWKRLHRPPGLDTGSASQHSCTRSRGRLALNALHGILPVQLLSGPTERWLVPRAYNVRMTTSTFYCTNRFYLDMATQQILTSDHHG